MKPAPVALFTYNRPSHTRQTLDCLKKNRLATDTDLIIFSDGPKDEKSEETVKTVRKYLKCLNGFKSVEIIERNTNMGLANSIIQGVTQIVSHYEKIIVLEDDLLTAPAFLPYMNNALENYADEEKVIQVSGYQFDVEIQSETNTLLLPFPTSWGWATWKQAWQCFDPDMAGFQVLKKNKTLRRQFNLDGSYNYYDTLVKQAHGKIDSWAIRWYLSVFFLRGLTLYPARSLIQNIGFDGSGTHCGNASIIETPEEFGYKGIFNFQFMETKLNYDAYEKIKRHLFSQYNIIKKIQLKLNF